MASAKVRIHSQELHRH